LNSTEQVSSTSPQFSKIGKTIVVGLLLVASVLASSLRAEPMGFRAVPSQAFASQFRGYDLGIAANGEITEATPNDFIAFLRATPKTHYARPIIFIDSKGGKILASTYLGKIFRENRVTAIIAHFKPSTSALSGGICFSACVYALIGAPKRVVPTRSKIGVHRMSLYEAGARRFDNGEMAAWLKRYAIMMGVSPELVDAAESASADALHVLTPAEITKWRVARIQSSNFH
jgi:hypothetical protein